MNYTNWFVFLLKQRNDVIAPVPRVDITQLPGIDTDILKKIIYTVNTFYGLKLDMQKTMNELYKEMDFRKAMDVLEKIIVMAI